MKRTFYKMHGAGNDYLFFDCTKEPIPFPERVARKLSERRFSVGGDGIILVEESLVADAKMRIFNADGSEGKMCGNGLRCFAKFLYEVLKRKKSEYTVETLSGIRRVYLTLKEDKILKITADMGAPVFSPESIPVRIDGERAFGVKVDVCGERLTLNCLSMGNPHCVVFCEDVEKVDLERLGGALQANSLFPEGVNAEFAEVSDKNKLKMRVFERGSGETLACGTGACAVAVAAAERGLCERDVPICVRLRGGTLTVEVTKETVFLSGPAECSFTGFVELN